MENLDLDLASDGLLSGSSMADDASGLSPGSAAESRWGEAPRFLAGGMAAPGWSPAQRPPSPDEAQPGGRAERSELAMLLACLARVTRPGAATAPAIGEGLGTQTTRRLLVIEDDTGHARVIEEILEGAGHQLRFAATLGHGVEIASRLRPDLILIDVRATAPLGRETVRRLQRDPLTCDLPLVLLCDRQDGAARCGVPFDAGVLDVIALPGEVEELRARVNRALDLIAIRHLLWRWANIDELTGLGNLRQLRERLRVEESRSRRYGTALAIVMMDVDGLKRVNEACGHAVGSRMLAAIGRVLRLELRASDLAVRYGGDEFVVLLPHAMRMDALQLCHRTIKRVRKLRVGDRRVTVSVGLASSEGAKSVEAQMLFRAADLAASHAKRLGGDRVCSASEVDLAPSREENDHV